MSGMKYLNLFLMSIVSFISMYILMYIMVNEYANVYPNLNQFYMATVMTLPMLIFELFFMRSMYPNKKINACVIAVSATLFIICIIFIRQQTAISDKEFLKSMIPHHASAILMCEKASLQDPQVKELCKAIVSAQRYEIDIMKEQLKVINTKK